jgi:DNA-binding NarL/FixJ family response regulator
LLEQEFEVHARSGELDQLARPATLTDVLEFVSRSRRAFHVVRLPETTIIAANSAAIELYGESADAIVGRPASSLFNGADTVHTSLALSSLATGAVDSFDARRRLSSRQGAEVWTCVRAVQVDDGLLALGMTVPAEEHRSLDAVEQEMASAPGIQWVPPLRAPHLHCSGHVSARGADTTFAVLDRLPPRQREIVAALLLGQRASDIGPLLFVSPSTVRSHLSAIFRAFGVHSQTELLALLRSQQTVHGLNGSDSSRRRQPGARDFISHERPN